MDKEKELTLKQENDDLNPVAIAGSIALTVLLGILCWEGMWFIIKLFI